MPAFYRASIAEFLHVSESELTGRLTTEYARSGFQSQRTSQTLAWIADILHLHSILSDVTHRNPATATWHILLEFPIPRKEKRIDVVLLAHDVIVILELKSSAHGIESIRQAEEYALLLHYFHQPSDRRRILPFVVAPSTRPSRQQLQQFLPILEAPAYWISPVDQISWSHLSDTLLSIETNPTATSINLRDWDDGEYRPVPTIIEAALSLQSGLAVREIAHSRAARHDVDRLTHFVTNVIDNARETGSFAICFVTGVPGSGKTLVGLNLAFGTKLGQEPIHFMSGTGPLVKVLQAVLTKHHQETAKVKAEEARRYAKTLIENVHVFARYYTDDNPDRPPSNHVIIFDEAQRAWDRAQNLSKFKRPYSEPEMLLKIMERHQDWAVVIALVGGGQEINSGEAGIEEWGRALSASSKSWTVYASPEALAGGSSVAGSRLETNSEIRTLPIHPEPQLHLDVSVRALKGDQYASWVNDVVNGDAPSAAARHAQDSFPILLTRSLADLRQILTQNTLGQSRCGLVASSGATRLRAEGLEPDSTFHGEYPWDHWYLAERSDVRSSYQLEVFATEFEIQGLELDWIGLCWGGDFTWDSTQSTWLFRTLRHGKTSKWSEMKSERRQLYRRNAYRVLLTRARQGVVIYIPTGDPTDPTRSPTEFDTTANFLLQCGARLMTNPRAPISTTQSTQPTPTLFN
jgi:hypothetical protein